MTTTNTKSFPTYTVTVRGEDVTFTSAFATLAEAYHALAATERRSEFADDLLARARARQLSPKQMAWLHKLATDAANRASGQPRVVALNAADLSNVRNLLLRARDAGKKFPKLHLEVEGQQVMLSLAGDKAREPGTVKIAAGRYPNQTLFGTITVDGKLDERFAMNATLKNLLIAINDNPAAAAGQHGVAIGRCCFCDIALSTAESRSAGYGPICAQKHGLPWGDSTAADEADKAAQEATKAEEPKRWQDYDARAEWRKANPFRRYIGE